MSGDDESGAVESEQDLELDLWEGQFEFVGPSYTRDPLPNQPRLGNNGEAKSSAHVWVDGISEQVRNCKL